MNSAILKTSKRLQRVDSVLADGKPHTTRDIVRAGRVCAVNSCIAELRANGRQIETWRKGNVYYYRRTK